MPIRDDSAGNYGTWDSSDLSWLDFIKATGSDVGNGAYNALSNITGALSPIGTSPEGNMSLQVPPMITGIADSYRRLSDPTGPGNAYRLTGVPELDAPIQQDMSNVLLSLYGGNALNPLARRPAGSVGAGVMREAEAQPIRAYRGFNPVEGRNFTPKELPLTDQFLFSSSSPDVAGSYAGIYANQDWITNVGAVAPVEMNFKNPKVYDARGSVWNDVDGTTVNHIADKAARDGHDGLIVNNVLDALDASNPAYSPATTYVALQRGTVKSPLTGETLFSDTGKPSIFGSAAATAGEQPRGQPMRGYRGARTDEGQFQPGDTYWATSNPEIANTFALQNEWPRQTVPNVSPVDVNFANPLVIDSPTPYDWAAVPFDGGTTMTNSVADAARLRGHDGVIFNNIMEGTGDLPATTYAALRPNTVRSATTGETIYSRGAPLPPQQDDDLPDWLKF